MVQLYLRQFPTEIPESVKIFGSQNGAWNLGEATVKRIVVLLFKSKLTDGSYEYHLTMGPPYSYGAIGSTLIMHDIKKKNRNPNREFEGGFLFKTAIHYFSTRFDENIFGLEKLELQQLQRENMKCEHFALDIIQNLKEDNIFCNKKEYYFY